MDFIPSFELSLTSFLFYTFCFFALAQFIYIVFIFSRLAFYRSKKKENTFSQPLSVVIAARNESDNLYHFLPKILNQDYPNFEVVVVNHQSIDDSNHVLKAIKREYGEKLKIVEVERSKHLGTGKKFPLSLGIKAASHEHLVFTDADCEPQNNQWLNTMAQNFDSHEIVLGFAPYRKKNGLLNKIIRFDTYFIGMNYLSFALAKIPYMAVGRNLAYTKKTFNQVNGFKSHYAIISGDDDLFIQDAARNKNYTVEINENTFCYSEGKDTWNNWTIQKTRHFTTTPHYRVIKKLLLGIYPLSLLLLCVSFILLLQSVEYRLLSAMIFTFIILLKWWIQGVCLSKLKGKSFIALFPFLDICYAFLIPWIYYTSDSSTYKWK